MILGALIKWFSPSQVIYSQMRGEIERLTKEVEELRDENHRLREESGV